jgi:hypothetical protein
VHPKQTRQIARGAQEVFFFFFSLVWEGGCRFIGNMCISNGNLTATFYKPYLCKAIMNDIRTNSPCIKERLLYVFLQKFPCMFPNLKIAKWRGIEMNKDTKEYQRAAGQVSKV